MVILRGRGWLEGSQEDFQGAGNASVPGPGAVWVCSVYENSLNYTSMRRVPF